MHKLDINQVYNGDSNLMIKSIESESVDLVIIDPPYKIRKKTDEINSLAKAVKKYNEELQRDNLINEYDKSILEELVRVMKRINIYIWCNKNQIRPLMEHYENKGCNVDLLVWHKTNPIPTCNGKYLSDLEYCVFARDKGVKLYGTYETKSKVYISQANTEDKKKYGHPTIKPLERIEEYIINSSQAGEIILDPFVGSGTTCVAAKRLGRKYIGFEINEKYYKIAKDRLQGWNQKNEMNLFDI